MEYFAKRAVKDIILGCTVRDSSDAVWRQTTGMCPPGVALCERLLLRFIVTELRILKKKMLEGQP